jgi:hypothetical protein
MLNAANYFTEVHGERVQFRRNGRPRIPFAETYDYICRPERDVDEVAGGKVAGSPGIPRRPHPRTAPGHDIEVLEKNTDTSWAAFQALQTQHESGFQKTEPAGLRPNVAPAAAGQLSVDEVMLEARRNNRVCPKPLIWQRLYDWLPNKPAQLPTVPGTRAEWDQLPPLEKRSRLREHVEWAALQGVLQKVHEGLKALAEDRWHHMGE